MNGYGNNNNYGYHPFSRNYANQYQSQGGEPLTDSQHSLFQYFTICLLRDRAPVLFEDHWTSIVEIVGLRLGWAPPFPGQHFRQLADLTLTGLTTTSYYNYIYAEIERLYLWGRWQTINFPYAQRLQQQINVFDLIDTYERNHYRPARNEFDRIVGRSSRPPAGTESMLLFVAAQTQISMAADPIDFRDIIQHQSAQHGYFGPIYRLAWISTFLNFVKEQQSAGMALRGDGEPSEQQTNGRPILTNYRRWCKLQAYYRAVENAEQQNRRARQQQVFSAQVSNELVLRNRTPAPVPIVVPQSQPLVNPGTPPVIDDLHDLFLIFLGFHEARETVELDSRGEERTTRRIGLLWRLDFPTRPARNRYPGRDENARPAQGNGHRQRAHLSPVRRPFKLPRRQQHKDEDENHVRGGNYRHPQRAFPNLREKWNRGFGAGMAGGYMPMPMQQPGMIGMNMRRPINPMDPNNPEAQFCQRRGQDIVQRQALLGGGGHFRQHGEQKVHDKDGKKDEDARWECLGGDCTIV